METGYDDNWEPPSEAMMKLLQARQERSDRISKLMGDYLLKGYKMLGTTCPQCDTILLETRQGTKYCIACSDLNSDADKDDPVTNQTAALALVREREVREESSSSRAATPAQPPLPVAPTTQTPPPPPVQPFRGLSYLMGANETANASSSTMGEETGYDGDWEPPSEAVMKLLQAQRERSDRISKLMGDYLLKGYKMLGTTCPQCDTILMETKQGIKYCIACSELDSDADKDDPVTNQTAALAQAREREVREESSSSRAATPAQPPLPVAPTTQTPPPPPVQPFRGLSYLMGPNETANASSSTMGEGEKYVKDLLDKMDWASAELRGTQSVDYSIQLCQLIKGCAEALSSVKAALSSRN